MGAHYQPMGHVQLVTNMVDYGMDVQAAIDAPRAFFVGERPWSSGRLPEATVDGLRARGHEWYRPRRRGAARRRSSSTGSAAC